MTVWLTGARGMLGRDVHQALEEAGHNVLATDLEVDIADALSVESFLRDHDGVELVANCAAWTNVDAAEAHEEDALRVNATGPATLARAAKAGRMHLLHISTDYVFDGTQTQPYKPDDTPNPQSAYGRTKLAGERLIAESGCDATIIRTAWLYGAGGKNFVGTMLRLFAERDIVKVVDDQYGSPTYTRDLAELICAVARDPAHGIFHYAGSGRTTWFGFAREIFEQAVRSGRISASCTVTPTTSAEYAAPAPRPANSELDCSRTAQVFGVQQKSWQQALERYLLEVGGNET